MFGEQEEEQNQATPPNETTHWLRVIAWLLFGIAAIGGAYLYFNPAK
jgi:hypothetical protein